MATFVNTISSVIRLPSSPNGNPRYRVVFVDGSFAFTEVDAQIGYAITNPEYKGVPVEFDTNKVGHIIGATPVGE